MDTNRLRTLLPGVPLVESPFFEQIVPDLSLDDESLRVARDLAGNGFAVLRFPDDEIDARAERIRLHLEPRFDLEGWRATGWAGNAGLRLQDAWTDDDDVKAIACNEHVLELLGKIFGRRAWPFQTLNFPVGTQQPFHSDSVHFSSIPERFMCGVWVALEDISEDAGPLVYYPGSHRWPVLYNEAIGVRVTGTNDHVSQLLYQDVWEAMVEANGVEPQYFSPRRGEALIWLANLLHGGARHTNPDLTRWSQVTHYYFDDCCYITPMLSDLPIGQPYLRDMVDISTGEHMSNVYVDAPIEDLIDRTKPVVAELPAGFDPDAYLRFNPDVAAAGVDPTEHYLAFGAREHRRYR